MSHKRLTTWQKATALVPLALLSGAWTTSLAVTSSASATSDEDSNKGSTSTLPDGTTVPDEALEAPASMSSPGSIAAGVPAGAAKSVIANATANGIPDAALAAYQRAEQVINSADKGCNLQWQLVAAIGRVESDHGRYGGNVLGKDGKSRPGIFGIPLDGSNGTQEIRDTDGGDLDDDRVYDRAVGAMQFIPQTWNVVGVDGDGDSKRDPQDLDDSALASAVYLCSGDEDLSTLGGQKASVYRYNHSEQYVDLVIAIMNAYLAGDFSSVPNGVTGTTVFSPSYGDAVVTPRTVGVRGPIGRPKESSSGGGSTGGATGGVPAGGTPTGSTGGDDGTVDTTPETTVQEPNDPVEQTEETVRDTTDTVEDTVEGTTNDPGGTVEDTTTSTLNETEATAKCLAQGLIAGTAEFDACVARLMS